MPEPKTPAKEPSPVLSPTRLQEQAPTTPEAQMELPPQPVGGARHHKPLEVVHTMVGRFVRGHVLHKSEVAEFSPGRLNELLADGALRPTDEAPQAPPSRPLPEEDAALASPPPVPAQDFDQRPGTPRAR